MIGANPRGGELECIAQLAVERLERRFALLRCNAPGGVFVGQEIVVVARRQFLERLVAPAADLVEDFRDGSRDVFAALAPVLDQPLELLRKLSIGGIETEHQAASAPVCA